MAQPTSNRSLLETIESLLPLNLRQTRSEGIAGALNDDPTTQFSTLAKVFERAHQQDEALDSLHSVALTGHGALSLQYFADDHGEAALLELSMPSLDDARSFLVGLLERLNDECQLMSGGVDLAGPLFPAKDFGGPASPSKYWRRRDRPNRPIGIFDITAVPQQLADDWGLDFDPTQPMVERRDQLWFLGDGTKATRVRVLELLSPSYRSVLFRGQEFECQPEMVFAHEAAFFAIADHVRWSEGAKPESGPDGELTAMLAMASRPSGRLHMRVAEGHEETARTELQWIARTILDWRATSRPVLEVAVGEETLEACFPDDWTDDDRSIFTRAVWSFSKSTLVESSDGRTRILTPIL